MVKKYIKVVQIRIKLLPQASTEYTLSNCSIPAGIYLLKVNNRNTRAKDATEYYWQIQ